MSTKILRLRKLLNVNIDVQFNLKTFLSISLHMNDEFDFPRLFERLTQDDDSLVRLFNDPSRKDKLCIAFYSLFYRFAHRIMSLSSTTSPVSSVI